MPTVREPTARPAVAMVDTAALEREIESRVTQRVLDTIAGPLRDALSSLKITVTAPDINPRIDVAAPNVTIDSPDIHVDPTPVTVTVDMTALVEPFTQLTLAIQHIANVLQMPVITKPSRGQDDLIIQTVASR